MFSLMQPGRPRPIDRPPARTPTPASPTLPIDTRNPAAEAPADWPPVVHPPDEKEDDEC